MAYTIERLEEAKRLFLKPRLLCRVEDANDNPRYSLRKRSPHNTRRVCSTWIDDDGDDNYNPKRNSVSKRKRPHRPGDVESNLAERQNSLMVTVVVKSDAGRAFLLSLPADRNYHDEMTLPALPSPAAIDGEHPRNPSTRIIHTSLAHPVTFDYEPPKDGSHPCQWCHNFTYGLLGLGKRTVEVLDFGNGRYIEVSGGHVAEGHEPSRMCVVCALERIHIMRCAAHRIVHLAGYQVDSFNFAAAYNSLVPIPGQGPPKKINPWCSLCPNPAFFGCSALQTVNKFQEPVNASSRDAIGCGLLLCERCEGLIHAARGDLAQVIMENEQRDFTFGSRADATYLLPGNDMYQFYIGS